MIPESWRAAPSALTLPPREVHVWSVSLVQPDPVVDRLGTALSRDERDRAARFHFEKDRRNFTTARGAMRAILARYLGVASESLRFDANAYGKPFLTPNLESDITFSLSRTDGMALLAVARSLELGVDIEFRRTLADSEELARSVFSQAEYAVFLTLSKQEREAAMLRGWTRKEAFVKATGLGLSFPLDAFDVSLDPREPASLLRIRRDLGKASDWSLVDLDVDRDYAAALAVKSRRFRLERWLWLDGAN